MDWQMWMKSWDHQQEGYLADRELRFEVIVDAIERTAGAAPRVLDLCGGPGSLGARVLERMLEARIVSVDADPVLQLIGQRSHGDERTTWIEFDIRDPTWEAVIAEHAPFDAVASTTALHWLEAPALAAVYQSLARLVRVGGIFANGDHFATADRAPKLADLQVALRRQHDDGRADYGTWWADLEAACNDDAALAGAFIRRAKEGTGHPDTSRAPDLGFHVAALRHAGFTDVGTVWQHGDNLVVVAFR
jgi:SAM-dependent methyltransferase